jgi:GNAT superfamily N-acetyltransferase
MEDLVIAPITDTPAIRAGLRDLLVDVVDHGGLVHFMAPLAPSEAQAFWEGALESLARGERLMFGAFDNDALVGTVTVILKSPPNAPHRAEIAKMMTLSSHRRLGVARALLRTAEREGATHGKTLLMLDTAAEGGSSTLYEGEGFIFCGVVPDHAHRPHGGLCATNFYYKQIPNSQLVETGSPSARA